MTRINIVPVHTLTDKHLLAEYKEITRPFNKVIKRLEQGTMHEVKIPAHYCLGEGHETFFFNKLYYLYVRYIELYKELVSRGVNVDPFKFSKIVDSFLTQLQGTVYWNDWTPTPEDMYLNMARLCKRSNMDNVIEEMYA